MSPAAPKQQRPKPGTFDRIRTSDEQRRPTDPLGKQALFSVSESTQSPPSLGSAAVECPKCGTRTVVSLPALVRMSATGVHAPMPKKGHRAWLKCPACGERAWMHVAIGH